jgi:SAM-dependent methyltransferase
LDRIVASVIDDTPSWWLPEPDFIGSEHVDPAFVAGYDLKQRYDPTGDVAALVHLGLGPGTSLLDLGAGTGVFARAAAATGAEVVAVDPSPLMVDVLRRRCADSPTMRVVTGGFLSYEHEGAPVGFVHTRNALHQIPDFWKTLALRRIAEWLLPDGVLMLSDLVYDCAPDEVASVIESRLASAVEDPSRGYTADDFAEHIRDEFSTFSWLLEPMLVETGFRIIAKESRLGMYVRYVCRRA